MKLYKHILEFDMEISDINIKIQITTTDRETSGININIDHYN